jgi:cytochrome c oxidase subunit 4
MTEARSYIRTWAALMALLCLTAASAFVPLGWGNLAVNLIIAVAKAALIGLVFMRLVRGGALPRLAVAVAALWIGIFFTLVLADYLSR